MRNQTTMILALALVASVQAENLEVPVRFSTPDTGAFQGQIDSNGNFQGTGLKKKAAGTNFITQASDGTARGGFTEQGVPLFLNNADAYGSVSAPAAFDSTRRISVTFDVPEGDTVTPGNPPGYIILLTTSGVTPDGGASVSPPSVGDKYSDSFEIINPGAYGSGVTFNWWKFRTTNISP